MPTDASEFGSRNGDSQTASIPFSSETLSKSNGRGMAIKDLLNTDEPEAEPPSRISQTVDTDSGRASYSPDSEYRSGETQGWTPVEANRRTPSRSPSIRQRREFRPTYQREEEFFIWYHRIDLGWDWTDIRHAYNRQFPHRRRNSVQGIQCKYYRCTDQYGIPRVRQRSRSASPREYGMLANTNGLRFSWMEGSSGERRTPNLQPNL